MLEPLFKHPFTVDFEHSIILKLQTSLNQIFWCKNNTEPQLSQHNPFACRLIMSENEDAHWQQWHQSISIKDVFVNVLSYYQTAGFRKKPPLHLEQYLRFVILLRYKYLYLRFLRFPPCGILWICPHFDQNILISHHLSFYPINWFHDKSANHISRDLSENAIERIGKCSQIRIVSVVSLEIKTPSFAAMILTLRT